MSIGLYQTSWNSVGSDGTTQMWKEQTFNCVTGDVICVIGLTSNATGSGTADVATQAGSTSAWTVIASSDTASAPGMVAAYATVTAAGSVTIRTTVPSGSATYMGAMAWLFSVDAWGGAPDVNLLGPHDADAKINVTVDSTSVVLYAAADWSAAAPGSALTPAGTSDVAYSDGIQWGVAVAHWINQAAGTRAYGPTSPAGTPDYNGVVLVVPNLVAANSSVQPGGTATALAGGVGSWTNPANATGAPNSVYANWTSP